MVYSRSSPLTEILIWVSLGLDLRIHNFNILHNWLQEIGMIISRGGFSRSYCTMPQEMNSTEIVHSVA